MTDALTPEKIEELRGLAEKATPGPWVFEETRARIRALTAENEAMRREKGNIAAIAKDLADRGYSGDAIAAAIRSGK